MLYEIIPPTEGRALRRKFVDKFAQKDLPQYRIIMGYGDYYGTNGEHQGLLWEVIRPYKFMHRSVACKYISQIDEVYIMWDYAVKSNPRNLQKSRVIKAKGTDIARYLNRPMYGSAEFKFLPNDLYVFDLEISFHITFTDINMAGLGYVCLTSLQNLDDYGISPALQEMFDLIDDDPQL